MVRAILFDWGDTVMVDPGDVCRPSVRPKD